MILEMDAGNTRIKWRLMKEQEGHLVKEAEGVVVAREKAPSVFIELGLQLDKLPLAEIRRMKLSNVRGNGFKTAFSSLMTEKWYLQPEFAVVKKACGGVTNSYDDVGTMGVDRWLAMLAAFKDCNGACCIVDCGSAVTLDLVDDVGIHRGGYIVPGFNMMREALANKSRVLKFENESKWLSTKPGITTEDAVNNGILGMVISLVERIHACEDVLSNHVNWFITGGDSEVLARHLDWDHKTVPDLVMDGLVISIS